MPLCRGDLSGEILMKPEALAKTGPAAAKL
jgi:hypothetical protein